MHQDIKVKTIFKPCIISIMFCWVRVDNNRFIQSSDTSSIITFFLIQAQENHTNSLWLNNKKLQSKQYTKTKTDNNINHETLSRNNLFCALPVDKTAYCISGTRDPGTLRWDPGNWQGWDPSGTLQLFFIRIFFIRTIFKILNSAIKSVRHWYFTK